MFGKLLKYDLRSSFRTFVPIWAAIIVLAFINSFTYKMQVPAEGIARFLALVLPTVLLTLLLVVSGTIAIVFMVRSFWSGLLGGEGYLMFTLPVSCGALIASKAISALVIEVLTCLAAILSGTIIMLFQVSWQSTVEALRELWLMIGPSLRQYPDFYASMALLAAGVLLWMLSVNLHTYTACAIGHLARNHRKLLAFSAFVGISILVEMLVSHIIGDVSLDEFFNPVVVHESYVGSCALFAGSQLAFCAVFFFATRGLLSRHLNLE